MSHWCDDQALNLNQRRLDAEQARAMRALDKSSYLGIDAGDTVRVRNEKGELSEPVRVQCRYDDIKGGLRLEKHVFGFVSWNAQDCVKVEDTP